MSRNPVDDWAGYDWNGGSELTDGEHGVARMSERRQPLSNDQDDFVDIVFDGPPGPEAGRFVEVEDSSGKSISVGEWVQDGIFWRLRINFKRMTNNAS